MPYQSFFSSPPPSSSATKGHVYQSFFGTDPIQAPSAAQLATIRANQKKNAPKPKAPTPKPKSNVQKLESAGAAVGRFFGSGTAKVANQAIQEAKQIPDTARAVVATATHNPDAYAAAVKRENANYKGFKRSGGILNVGTITTEGEARKGDLKTGVKKIGGGVLASGAELVPLGRGVKVASKVVDTGRVLKDLTKGQKALRLGRAATEGAAYGAAGSAGSQLASNGKVDLTNVAKSGGLGAVLGTIGGAVGLRGHAASVRKSQAADMNKLAGVDETAGKAATALKNEDKFAASIKPKDQKLLGTGAEYKQSRINEIDKQLEGLRKGTSSKIPSTTPNKLGKNVELVHIDELSRFMQHDRGKSPLMSKEKYQTLKADIQKNGIKEALGLNYGAKDKVASLGEGNHRLAIAKELGIKELPVEVTGTGHNIDTLSGKGYSKVPGAKPDRFGYVSSNQKPSDIGIKTNDTATQARQLLKERATLQNEVDGIQSVPPKQLDKPSLDVKNPKVAKAVDNELQAIDNTTHPTGVAPEQQTKKINALTDYFRTPTKALKRIGLTDTAKTVEGSFKNYREDLRNNMTMLKGWEKRTKNMPDGSSTRIFKYLDGQSQRLSGDELKVADEMKQHFSDWADKLGLPKEGRVSDYITHIFEGDPKNVQDPNLASILDNKATSSATNPFLKKRYGKEGFKQDAFAAMEAYMKKSTRKLHMDPALKSLADASKNVDDRTARYLIKLNHSIAMKPDRVEQFVNDAISSIPGIEKKFGNQAGTKAMRAWRNTVYRATLGLNVGSAMRNLTQGTNTFAELGTRDTLAGYTKLIRTFGDAAKRGSAAWDELNHMGILDDAVHMQDRNVTTLKNKLQKLDKGLWAMFDTAERINRGSAYFGAKAKAMRRLNMTEEQAQNYAREVVGKTQFRFNDVETPLALRSQVAKTIGQFQSFNIKQAEFLGGTAKGALKGDTKEIAKAIRWAAANIAMASTVGGILGIKWTDAIPDFGTFRGVRSPLLTTGGNVKTVVTGKNQYGQATDRKKLAKASLKSESGLIVPGGTQINKTADALNTVSKGSSKTEAGRTRFLVDKSTTNKVRGALFGQYNLDEGKKFFAEGNKPLSDTQTKIVDSRNPQEKQAYYDMFQALTKSVDSKTKTGKDIRKAVNDKQFEKAKRLANDHNNKVQGEIDKLQKRHNIPQHMQDYLHSTYKVNYKYYTRKQKNVSWQ